MPGDKLILTLFHNILVKPHHNPIRIPLTMNSIVIGNIGKFLRRITLTTFIIGPRCLSFFSLLTMRNVVRISDMAVMTIRQILNISSVN